MSCVKHGESEVGVLTGICMACERDAAVREHQAFIAGMILRGKKSYEPDPKPVAKPKKGKRK